MFEAEAEAEAKILASKPPRGLNITANIDAWFDAACYPLYP